MYLLRLEKSQVTLISFTQFKLEFNQFKIILGVLSHYSSPLYRNVCFQEKMDINTGWNPEMGILPTSHAVRVDIYTEGAVLDYVCSSLQYRDQSGKGDKQVSAEQN